ncbi:MAG: hypothetical protein E6P95_04030 [Candidatus Moraniibacteriota bacterium]|nr:MAG: hypothetical protein E6P95_04030 [Candidatus Moranbacteria bacterium]
MQKKSVIASKVINQINTKNVKIKPRWIFVLGTILAALGVVVSIASAAVGLYLFQFALLHPGRGADRKLDYALSTLPWYVLPLSLLSINVGWHLLKKFDFSYQKNRLVVTVLFVLGIALGVAMIPLTNLDDLLYTRGYFRSAHSGDVIINSPSTLKPSVVDALALALDDEYKALATYDAIIKKFGSVRPFSQIIKSEEMHINSLLELYKKYDLTASSNPYLGTITAPATLSLACSLGVEAEVANAELYNNKLLPQVAEYSDITTVFNNLMNASQSKHLPAFTRCQ